MKKEIITIAGAVGSGKSSTAKRVASLLSYQHLSSGDLFRKIASERGLSVEALNLTAEEQADIDHQVDSWLKELGQTGSKVVIDSRLAWHWMPESYKVFLTLDHDTAAERIFNHIQTEGRVSQTGTSLEEVRQNIDTRVASEQKRYRELYNVDVTDTAPFDLVIDTKTNGLEAVVASVIEGYRAWRAL